MGPVFSMEARIKPIFSALDGAWYRCFFSALDGAWYRYYWPSSELRGPRSPVRITALVSVIIYLLHRFSIDILSTFTVRLT